MFPRWPPISCFFSPGERFSFNSKEHNTYSMYCLLLWSPVAKFCSLLFNDGEGVVSERIYPILAMQSHKWNGEEKSPFTRNHHIPVSCRFDNSGVTKKSVPHPVALSFFFRDLCQLIQWNYGIYRFSEIWYIAINLCECYIFSLFSLIVIFLSLQTLCGLIIIIFHVIKIIVIILLFILTTFRPL